MWHQRNTVKRCNTNDRVTFGDRPSGKAKEQIELGSVERSRSGSRLGLNAYFANPGIVARLKTVEQRHAGPPRPIMVTQCTRIGRTCLHNLASVTTVYAGKARFVSKAALSSRLVFVTRQSHNVPALQSRSSGSDQQTRILVCSSATHEIVGNTLWFSWPSGLVSVNTRTWGWNWYLSAARRLWLLVKE